MPDDRTKEEAIRLVKAGYNVVLEQQVLACTAPLFWYDKSAPLGDRIRGNGTIFVVQLPDRLVGVTAEHVLRGFELAREQGGSIQASVFDVDFPLADRVIARSPNPVDLATFAVEQAELESFRKTAHQPPYDWPPPPPQEDRGVLFSGFPGVLRDEQGLHLFWTPYSAQTVASVVQPDRIMVQFAREFLIDPLNRGIPPANLWLGGMSGCLLFALWETPLVHLQLSGVGIEQLERRLF